MYDFINRNIIYPSYFKWHKDYRLRYLGEKEETQWLSQDEILSRQFEKFKQIMEYAYNNSPFYKKIYTDSGVVPADIKTFSDIEMLPMVSKKDLQENLDSIVSLSFPKKYMYQDASGGSTGKPTAFYGDKRSRAIKYAAGLRSDRWSGWNIGESSAYLWGVDHVENRYHAFKKGLVEKYIFRIHTLDAFNMTETDMDKFAKALSRIKPSLIVAYSNAAFIFSNFLLKTKKYNIHPKGVVCSAETLTDEKRTVIEQAFKCRVLNRYGSREIGLISAECECQEGMHINAEDVLVQFCSHGEDKNGEQLGSIVVTDFNNYATPFVRYNMDDLSMPLDKICTCGRGLPLMGQVKGRSSDFIKTPKGAIIHGEYFSHLFYGMKEIRQFQVVQNSLRSLEFNIVSSGELTDEMKQSIITKVRSIMDDDVIVDICLVDAIPLLPSGKYRFAISKI